MQRFDPQQYFARRAAEERAAAERARDERAAQPHRELARRYADVAKGDLKLVSDTFAPSATGLPAEFTILP